LNGISTSRLIGVRRLDGDGDVKIVRVKEPSTFDYTPHGLRMAYVFERIGIEQYHICDLAGCESAEVFGARAMAASRVAKRMTSSGVRPAPTKNSISRSRLVSNSCGYGEYDLYVTFQKNDDSWMEPVNLGGDINSSTLDARPYVTPDGKFLFYHSDQTGNGDIYWVNAKIIDLLRPDDLTSNPNNRRD